MVSTVDHGRHGGFAARGRRRWVGRFGLGSLALALGILSGCVWIPAEVDEALRVETAALDGDVAAIDSMSRDELAESVRLSREFAWSLRFSLLGDDLPPDLQPVGE